MGTQRLEDLHHNGIHADLVIVAAITDPGKAPKEHRCSWSMRMRQASQKSKKIEKIGQHTSDTALLFFTDVRLPADALLGEVNKGFAILMDELPRERQGIAARYRGLRRCLDITIEYVKEREAFGQKVGQFQNTRFKLADVKTQVAVNRAFYEQCANKYATDELTTEEAAMLKLASCECNVTLQINVCNSLAVTATPRNIPFPVFMSMRVFRQSTVVHRKSCAN